jgi:hypothetical protein
MRAFSTGLAAIFLAQALALPPPAQIPFSAIGDDKRLEATPQPADSHRKLRGRFLHITGELCASG